MLTAHGRCLRTVAISDDDKTTPLEQQTWMQVALNAFELTVKRDNFPCLFARKSVINDSIEKVFVSEKQSRVDLIAGVRHYIEHAAAWTIKQRVGKPLVIFFEKNDFTSLAEEQAYAWYLLQQLHDEDTQPWPDAVATDMHSEQWSFCFMGMPLFINMSFPSHRLMKSRNLGPHIVFVINPRENFDHVAAGDSLSGQRIRARIRARAEAYNEGLLSLSLGVFGEPGSLEFKQYQLQEHGSLTHEQCPFHMNLKHTTKANTP